MDLAKASLNDWLSLLEHRHAEEIQLGLTRVHTVAARLGLLTWAMPVLMVAGTNGKGSTVASLEAIYTTAGYRVGSYTSPHLLVFNERIRVNQHMIKDEQLCQAFMAIEEGRADIPLTYFEMTTLAALWYFKSLPLDVVILEVGLGGRLDATNIIDPDLAIITTIDLDHQAYLGDTKEAIGYEKAGILRQQIPFIYADTHPPVSVLNQARSLDTSLYCLGEQYSFDLQDALVLSFQDQRIELPLPRVHPQAFAAACVASYCLDDRLPVTHQQRCMAAETVFIQGRQEWIRGDVSVLLDVSHNPQSVALLAKFLHNQFWKGKVHAVFSGLSDKDLCGLIQPMLACVNEWYPAVLSSKRAASASQLLEAFLKVGCVLQCCYHDPLLAYRAAVERASNGDLIVVYGSFLTVGAIMSHLPTHRRGVV